MRNPFFSIIIPTYNRAKRIKAAIDSVLNQTFQDFEIIVVDDGSTDNTAEIISNISDDRVLYIKKKNEERGAARNTGANLASGLYVNFFDSDDKLYAHHLSVAYQFIQNHGLPEILRLGYDFRDEKGKLLRVCAGMKDINAEIISGNLLSCNGVVVRRDVFMDNQFNEDRNLATLEDWELWIRMASKYRIHCVDEVTSTLIEHTGRSVVNDDVERIKGKVNCFIKVITANADVNAYYQNKIKYAKGSALTYASLHLAMAGARRADILHFLISGLWASPREFFKRRLLAIIKLAIMR